MTILKNVDWNSAINTGLRDRLRAIEGAAPDLWKKTHEDWGLVAASGFDCEIAHRRFREIDSRVSNAMTGAQEESARGIQDAFEQIVGESMARVTTLYKDPVGSSRSCPAVAERSAQLRQAYWRWGPACARHGLCATAALDILCFGYSGNGADKSWRKRRCWAVKNLRAALDLFGRIQDTYEKSS